MVITGGFYQGASQLRLNLSEQGGWGVFGEERGRHWDWWLRQEKEVTAHGGGGPGKIVKFGEWIQSTTLVVAMLFHALR